MEDSQIFRWVPLDCMDEILPEEDIVILSIALTEETRGLMNVVRLAEMKTGSVLVNVSRGAIIDEKALVQKLKQGKFRGAALDVVEEEPLSAESELWDLQGVIISPHNSFVGDGTKERMFDLICSNLKRV